MRPTRLDTSAVSFPSSLEGRYRKKHREAHGLRGGKLIRREVAASGERVM